jgi:hypothetical protein
MKSDPVSGTSAAPGKETASEPDQDGGAPFGPRRKVAVPENGEGGITVAVLRPESNSKLDGGPLLITKRMIETPPFLSREMATKLARPLRPKAEAVNPRWLPVDVTPR